MDIRNPEKKHDKKAPEPEQRAPVPVEASGGITAMEHVPYVEIRVGEVSERLSMEDSLEMASTIFQATLQAYNDAVLYRFYLARGMTPLQVTQELAMFQQFRKQITIQAQVQKEIAQAVERKPEVTQ